MANKNTPGATEQQVSGDQPIAASPSAPQWPGPPPPQYITAGKGMGINPAYVVWQQKEAAYEAAEKKYQAAPKSSGGSQAKPAGATHVQSINGYDYVVDSTGNIVSVVGPTQGGTGAVNPYSSIGGGGGITAYEQAQVALEKQKLADAEAQQKADQEYRQAQALDTFNKNEQEFQTKHFYGSIAGPSYAAPAGAPNWWKLPEPGYVADYYKNNPSAGPDPWNQPNPYSGYTGSGFSNPQQPGTQVTPPAGGVAAGGQVANPFPGVTSGAVSAYNPNAPQTGQNIPGLTPPPIASSGTGPRGIPAGIPNNSNGSLPPTMASLGGFSLPPKSMAMGGGGMGGSELAVVHCGVQVG